MREAVVQFCTDIGADPLLVQGAGGNISWKEEDTLYVKASGTWMARAREEDIFVPVLLSSLREAMARGEFRVRPQVLGPLTHRPSMETLLHALMPQNMVAHLHMVSLLAWLVQENCEAPMMQMLEGKAHALFLDYHTPGYPLAQALGLKLRECPRPSVVLLKGHGVILGGDNPEEVKGHIHLLRETFHLPTAKWIPIPPLPETLRSRHGVCYRPIPSDKIQQLVFNKEMFKGIQSYWALYPDHVVFLGERPFVYSNTEEWDREENSPEVIFIEDKGIFAQRQLTKAQILQLECYHSVLERRPPEAPLCSLTPQEIKEILGQEAEAHRLNVNAGHPC